MKIRRQKVGLALVFTGAALLMISFPTGLRNSNVLLISAWLMIVAGIITHVYNQKRTGKY